MNYNDVKNIVFDTIVDKLGWDVDDFGLNSKFGVDLGVDSLDAVELMMEFEIKFGISVSDNEFGVFSRDSTVKDAIDFLCKKLNISIETKMKVKCINQRNFRNLTLNQVYEVVEESVDFYHVVNNAGSTQRYAKEYFEVVNEELPKEIVEEPIVEDEDGIVENEVKIEVVESEIKYYINDNYYGGFTKYGLVSSNCGIESLDGLNNMYENLIDDFEEDIDELMEEIIKEILSYYSSQTHRGCIVFSTNDYHEKVWNLMNKLSSGNTGVFFNPNSDNQVNMWWFLISQGQ